MKQDLVRLCVESLKQIRAQKHEELDTSTTFELDTVIQKLESCLSEDEEVTIDPQLSMRTLEIMDRCLSVATNLSELIQTFFNGE